MLATDDDGSDGAGKNDADTAQVIGVALLVQDKAMIPMQARGLGKQAERIICYPSIVIRLVLPTGKLNENQSSES